MSRRHAAGLSTLLVALAITLAPPVSPARAESSLAGAPKGANDWTCKPSSAHPRPVVLVHGAGATMGLNWSYLSPRLKERGYCVYALTYGLDPRIPLGGPGGLIPIQESAVEFASFVDRVLARTGARKVDLVGHSEGTYMPQYWLKFLGGAGKVKRYVALTPLYDGTNPAGVLALSNALMSVASPLCGACPQFITGSPMQRKLAAGGAAVPGIDYTTIMTKYDEAVRPYTSGYLPGEQNYVLQDVCPNDLSEHDLVAVDPVAAQITFNALDPAHAQPIKCGGLLSR